MANTHRTSSAPVVIICSESVVKWGDDNSRLEFEICSLIIFDSILIGIYSKIKIGII